MLTLEILENLSKPKIASKLNTLVNSNYTIQKQLLNTLQLSGLINKNLILIRGHQKPKTNVDRHQYYEYVLSPKGQETLKLWSQLKTSLPKEIYT